MCVRKIKSRPFSNVLEPTAGSGAALGLLSVPAKAVCWILLLVFVHVDTPASDFANFLTLLSLSGIPFCAIRQAG